MASAFTATRVLGVGLEITAVENVGGKVRAIVDELLQTYIPAEANFMMLVDGVGSTSTTVTGTGTHATGYTYFDLGVNFPDADFAAGAYVAPMLTDQPSWQYTTWAAVRSAHQASEEIVLYRNRQGYAGCVWNCNGGNVSHHIKVRSPLPNQKAGFSGAVNFRQSAACNVILENIRFLALTPVIGSNGNSLGTFNMKIHRCYCPELFTIYGNAGNTVNVKFTSSFVSHPFGSNTGLLSGDGDPLRDIVNSTFIIRNAETLARAMDGYPGYGNNKLYNCLCLGAAGARSSIYRANTFGDGDYNATDDASADLVTGSTSAHNQTNFKKEDMDAPSISEPFVIGSDCSLVNAGGDYSAHYDTDEFAVEDIFGNAMAAGTFPIGCHQGYDALAVVDFPDVGNVLNDDTVNGVTGTYVAADVAKYLDGEFFGEDGTEFEGELAPDFPEKENVLTTDTVDGVQGEWTKADKTKVLTGNDFGNSGSEVAEYSPDFPETGNVLTTDTVNGNPGTWQKADKTKVLTGNDFGDGGTSEVASYSPDFPSVNNVTEDDTTNGEAGVYHEATVAEVEDGVLFGANQELEGELSVEVSIPAAPTITIADDETGTSLTVTIDGDAGVTNYVKYKLTSASTWSDGGNRSGDGDVQITGLTEGAYYHIYAVSKSSDSYGAPSTIYISKPTDGSDTIFETLFDKVVDALETDVTLAARSASWSNHVIAGAIDDEMMHSNLARMTDCGALTPANSGLVLVDWGALAEIDFTHETDFIEWDIPMLALVPNAAGEADYTNALDLMHQIKAALEDVDWSDYDALDDFTVNVSAPEHGGYSTGILITAHFQVTGNPETWTN